MSRLIQWTKLFLLVSPLFLLLGCQLRPAISDDAVYVRGIVRQVDNHYQYRPCGRDGWFPLQRLSENVKSRYRERLGAGSGAPLYLEGWHEIGSKVSFDKLMLIGGDLGACTINLDGVDLRASGNDPAWLIDLRPEQLVLHLYQRNETWKFHRPEFPEIHGNDWVWNTSVKTRGRTRRLALTVSRTPCEDEYGVWFALSAELSFKGQSYKGCARYGDLGVLGLFSEYHTRPQLLTTARLKLKTDHSAVWTVDRNNGQRVEKRTAHWEMRNGRLLLSLDADNRGRGDVVLLWRFDHIGNLVLLSSSERYGKGLILVRGGGSLQWSSAHRDQLP